MSLGKLTDEQSVELSKRFIDAKLKSISKIKSEAREYCQNKDFPLEDRWEIFMAHDLGEIHSWIWRPEWIDHQTWDNYIFGYHEPARHETVCLVDLVDDYLDDYSLNQTGKYSLQSRCPEFCEAYDRDTFKEGLLQAWVKGYINDW